MDRWYVYFDDQLRPWAVRLPAWIGEHPDLGFAHIDGPAPDPAPAHLRLRRVALADAESGRTWYVPVGHPMTALIANPGASVLMPSRGGTRRLRRVDVHPEARVRRARPADRRGSVSLGDRTRQATPANVPAPLARP